ncbi:MAG: hypothetical protein AAF797_09320 [Planctomycetota bacterium]
MGLGTGRRGWFGEVLVWGVVGLAMAWVGALSWGTVNHRPVWMDEASSWRTATEQGYGALLLHRDDDVRHPTLSFLVIKAVLGVTGGGEAGSVELLWLRAGALGAGVLAVGMAGLLGRVALGRFGALACAVLAANDPVLLAQSQQARMFSLMMLGQTAAMACAVVVLRGGVLGGVLGRLGRVRLLAAVGCGLGLAVAFNAVYLGLVVFGALALAGVWAVAWAWWRGREVAVGAGGVTREVGVVALVGTLGSIGSLWFLAAFTAGGGSAEDKGSGLSWETLSDTVATLLASYGQAWSSAVVLLVGVVGMGCWWWRGSGLNGGVGRSVAVMLAGVLVLSVLVPMRVRATSHWFITPRFFSAVGPWLWLGVTTAAWVGVRGLVGWWVASRERRAGRERVDVGAGGGWRRVVAAWGLGGAVVLGVAGIWRVGVDGIDSQLALSYRVGAVVEALRESGVRPGDRYAIEQTAADELLTYAALPVLEQRARLDPEVVLSVDATSPADGGAWYLVLERLNREERVAIARTRLTDLYGRWMGDGRGLPTGVAEHVVNGRMGVYRMDGDGSVWHGEAERRGRGWELEWELVGVGAVE